MQVAPCLHLYAVKPHICYPFHTILLDCLRCPYYRIKIHYTCYIACGICIIEARLRALLTLVFNLNCLNLFVMRGEGI